MKKLTLRSVIFATIIFTHSAAASHGSWPPPPEAQVSGTMSLLSPAGTLDDILFDSSQSWAFVSALAWPDSTVPTTVTSTPSTQLFGNAWTININETYNGSTGEGAPFLTPLVSNNQLGINFNMIWETGESYNLTQVWEVLIDDFSNDTTLNPLDLNLNGLTGSTFVGGTYNGMSLSMQFISTVPLPTAVWLFGSGIIGLVTFASKSRGSTC